MLCGEFGGDKMRDLLLDSTESRTHAVIWRRCSTYAVFWKTFAVN